MMDNIRWETHRPKHQIKQDIHWDFNIIQYMAKTKADQLRCC